MSTESIDPIVKRAVADGVVERASKELNKLIRELAAALDPFPNFLGISSIQAVEIDPSGVADPEKGCVVVLPDGVLYELVLRMLPGPVDIGGVDQIEEMKDLELAPGDYVAYAYAAVQELARILEEREEEREQPSATT
ncbi:MAG: hypothetical protein IH862_03650 [Chloroflexi bacterium]|nr:hypothetical protein [Chloroflexota bacterium]